jgi:hypothetical protein
VDLATARVQVVEQAAEVAGKIIVSPPKTDVGRRVVTLPSVAVDALADHLEQYAEPGPDGLAFTTPGGAYLLRSPFNRFVWRPAVALRYQDVMADRQAALASALDDLALAATRPRGTERARTGTHRARRQR